MKIQIIRLIAGFFGIAFLMAGTQIFAGSITNSAHDFSGDNWSGGRICIACHTPHNADTSVTASPLWNHEVTQTDFTMYSSNSLDGVIGTVGGTSKLCLSCHDGTVAIDSFGGVTGGDFIGGGDNLGTTLADDHPISITYDTGTATSDGGLHDPSATNITIGTGGDKTRIGTIDLVMLSGGEVQCSSCHDVHNTFTVPGTPLLKVTDAGSALCLTCHDK